MSQALTFSEIKSAKKCALKYYLRSNQENDIRSPSVLQMSIYQQIEQLKEIAQKAFGDRLSNFKEKNLSDEQKEEVFSQDQWVIANASFQSEHFRAKPDFLIKTNDQLELILIKAASKVKQSHIEELSFQWNVLHSIGYTPNTVSVWIVDNKFIYHGKEFGAEIFRKYTVTKKVLREISSMNHFMNFTAELSSLSEAPEVAMGNHCIKPYTCDYYTTCKARKRKNEPLQETATSGNRIRRDSLSNYLGEINYPISFIDFECVGSAIPFYLGTRAFEQIPFMFSLHIIHEAGEAPQHEYFIAREKTDPRQKLRKELIRALPEFGSILVFDYSSELRILRSLFSNFSERRNLEAIQQRLVDLRLPFEKEYVVLNELNGKSSLKAIMTFISQIGSIHDKMNISDGATANRSYLEMIKGTEGGMSQETFSDLINYCSADTISMVKIYEYLKNLSIDQD